MIPIYSYLPDFSSIFLEKFRCKCPLVSLLHAPLAGETVVDKPSFRKETDCWESLGTKATGEGRGTVPKMPHKSMNHGTCSNLEPRFLLDGIFVGEAL